MNRSRVKREIVLDFARFFGFAVYKNEVPVDDMGRNIRSSVQRALAVLEAFGKGEPDLALADVAHLAGLSKPTTHRLLQGLTDTRCLIRDPVSRRYRMGPRVFELGMVFHRQLDLRRQALPHMHALRDACGETVVLSALVDDAVIILEQAVSRLELKLIQELGRPYPVVRGATGRILMAFLPKDQQERLFRAARPPLSRGERERLRQRLADARRDGMAVSTSERVLGALAVSGPLWGHAPQPVAALSVTGPVSRFSAAAFRRLIPELQRTLEAISLEVGGGAGGRAYPASRFVPGGESHARLMAAFCGLTEPVAIGTDR
jgi:DNA-binding IclR family transcriptional regulator